MWCNSTSQPKATVTLEKDEIVQDHATGAGAVDALYKTIDKIVETKFELIDYVIQAVTEGQTHLEMLLFELNLITEHLEAADPQQTSLMPQQKLY